MGSFFKRALESLGSLLPDVKTPKELLLWLDKNVTYKAVSKGFLLSPREVIEKGEGHCWETTELARRILTELGKEVWCYYLENKSHTTTHTTLIFKDGEKYFWFEWAWYPQAGIKEYPSHGKAEAALYKAFEAAHGQPLFFTREKNRPIFHATDDENAVVEHLRQWRPVRLSKEV